MATEHLAKLKKKMKSRPGSRAVRARQYAIRTFQVFLAVSVAAITMIVLGIDIPGAAWYYTGY